MSRLQQVAPGATILALLLAGLAGAARADQPQLLNDYGGAGFWQTPSARFGGDGQLSVGVSSSKPYNRLFIGLEPLPGVEAILRYTDVTNRLYSDVPEFSGNQSYKDRSFDLRLRLLRESDRWPELALGLRDLGGTNLFTSQYLVASRRYYDFDFSLGLGWGRMGTAGTLPNPLDGLTGDAQDLGRGGKPDLGGTFSGSRMGVFGGLAWQTPWPRLQLAAELDSNDFSQEALDNNQPVRWPVNLGLKYRLRSGLQAGLSWQRGDILAFQLALQTNFNRSQGFPKLFDPPPPAPRRSPVQVQEAESAPQTAAPALEASAPELHRALAEQRIGLAGYTPAADGRSVDIWIGPGPYKDPIRTVGRAARAAAAVLPEAVTEIRITGVNGGIEVYEARINRLALDRTAVAVASPDELLRDLEFDPPRSGKPARQYPDDDGLPEFRWGLSPQLRSSIGGPDGFYFGQIWMRASAGVRLTPSWSLSSQVGFNVVHNFDEIKLQSDSVLPHVRSDIVRYLQEGEQSLVRLESNTVRQLAPNWYGRFSAGIFEEMFGGVAGEILYRPDDPRWAVGANINRVRQRDYDQRFQFLDYEVTTGHLTGYFRIPRPDLLLRVSVGQYLAGDRGGTVELSRRFSNGMRAGVFATKTDVSAEQFGEGSFDKGFFFIVPFDLFTPQSTRNSGSFVFRPLTRDGGQMVRDGPALFDLTYDAVQVRIPERASLFFD